QGAQIETGATAGAETSCVEVEITVAEDGWPPLCNPVQAPNGVWIVPLTDPRELNDEGRAAPDSNGVCGLNHCVGGYAYACRSGRSHILSLRAGGSHGPGIKRLSTVEIMSVVPGEVDLNVRQHRGPSNRAPDRSATLALEWFLG